MVMCHGLGPYIHNGESVLILHTLVVKGVACLCFLFGNGSYFELSGIYLLRSEVNFTVPTPALFYVCQKVVVGPHE